MQLSLKEQMKQLEKNSPAFNEAALRLRGVVSADDLRADLLSAVADRAFIGEDPVPRTPQAFEAQRGRARTRLPAVASGALRILSEITEQHQLVVARTSAGGPLARVHADIRAQLGALVYKGFLSSTPWDQLAHLPRYLKAMLMRLQKYAADPGRDARHAQSVAELTKRYEERLARQRKAGLVDPRLEEFRWHLEELRVSLFAQELKTPYPVSGKRLDKIWNALSRTG
jgi:ATP-dependent helicase HrpA